MISGIVAAQAALSGGGAGGGAVIPDWVPDGALAHLDFVTNRYFSGGAVTTAAAILGGGYDAGDRDHRGLFIGYGTNDNRPHAIGTLFTDLNDGLVAGCSIVVDMQIENTAGFTRPSGRVVDYFQGSNPNTALWYVGFEMEASFDRASVYDDTSVSAQTGNSPASTQVWTVACTLNRSLGGGSYGYAICLNGGTVATDTVGYFWIASDMGTIRLFGVDEFADVLEEVWVRSLTVFSAKTSAELQAACVPNTAGEEADAAFANVVLLSGFEGTDSAGDAPDESTAARDLVFRGDAHIDTGVFKFGAASLALGGAGYVIAGPHDDYLIRSYPFSVEFFIRLANTSQTGQIVGVFQSIGATVKFSWRLVFTAGNLNFQLSEDGTNNAAPIDVASGMSANAWHHVCIERSNIGKLRVFVDGVLKASAYEFRDAAQQSEVFLSIGADADGGSPLHAHIDELRIAKGAAFRASDATFTPPTAAYPRS